MWTRDNIQFTDTRESNVFFQRIVDGVNKHEELQSSWMTELLRVMYKPRNNIDRLAWRKLNHAQGISFSYPETNKDHLKQYLVDIAIKLNFPLPKVTSIYWNKQTLSKLKISERKELIKKITIYIVNRDLRITNLDLYEFLNILKTNYAYNKHWTIKYVYNDFNPSEFDNLELQTKIGCDEPIIKLANILHI